MHQSLRLFFAGAIGGLAGGFLTHHYSSTRGFLGFLVLLVGIVLGALCASAIYDPRGTWGVVCAAFKKVGGCFQEKWREAEFKKFFLMVGIGVRDILVFFFCLALCCASWVGLILLVCGEKNYGLTTAIGALSFFTMAFVSAASGEPNDHFPQAKTSFKALFRINSIVGTYFALKFAIYVLRHIVEIVTFILWAIWTIPMLILNGLSECRGRTAAMIGAVAGVVTGYLWWNPLVVGLVGGVSSLLVQALVTKWKPAVKARWSKVCEYWGSLLPVGKAKKDEPTPS